MTALKFDQKSIASKGFSENKEVTELVKTDINKVVASDKIPCNNGKD